MVADAVPTFEVATIKPSDPNRSGWGLGTKGTHFFTVNTNMNDLISFAYGVHAKQIVDGPGWFLTEKFDIDGLPDVPGKPNREQLKGMVQKLLANRFKLAMHHDQRELAVYALTVGKSGLKLSPSPAASTNLSGWGLKKAGVLGVKSMTMAEFASVMQRAVLDKPVLDQTGLKDRYDFTLSWTPDSSQFSQMSGSGMNLSAPADDGSGLPGLYTAIQEELGLKLEAVRAMADVVVIDRAEKPSDN
jgi:uncharacterized protein (TIGR03435 family)